MSFQITPGSVIGCKVNSHRSHWNGSICNLAASWSCGSPQDFRQDFCERGDDRCFHLRLFDERDPHLVGEENGTSWILQPDIQALDDQILIFWGAPFQEPRGIREGVPQRSQVFGLYRVGHCEARPKGSRTHWLVRPHADGWARVRPLQVTAPTFEPMRGPYFKQVSRRAFESLLEEIAESLGAASTEAFPGRERERLGHFLANAPKWLDQAAARARTRTSEAVAPVRSSAPLNQPLRELGRLVTVSSARPGPAPAQAASPAAIGLIEPTQAAWITRHYGEETLQALRLGSLTKPLLVLRGLPGVGKSTLAVHLLEDPKRERTLIVSVASTWRGREDLLGWVSPIHGEFEATPFTRFLLESEQAWKRGDKRPRVVVFEEFNLSQPEYWLSDLLVRSQHEDERDRIIELGGTRVRGWSPETTRVFLSPAVRFVATINADHTSRPLSPRVLDRAALVELVLEPERALELCGLALEPEQLEAVSQLDSIARDKSASFSLRTARSLQAGLAQRQAMGLDEWGTLDLVLLQEVLSKVRLFAADPADRALLEDFVGWSKGPGKRLLLCCREVDEWRERLADNQDVQRA